MDAPTTAVQDLQSVTSALVALWQEKLPSLLAALAIIVVGWLLARLARGGARHFANHLNRFLDRSLRWGGMASARVPSSAIAVIGEILFWAVVLLSLAVAARVAGVALFTLWFDNAATHFPHLLIGTLLIVIGWVVASQVGSSGGNAESLSRRVAQALIVAVAMIVGFEQMGLDMKLPVVLLGIGIGATSLAFSVAFGLGAREFVAANIAGRALNSQLHRGMRIKLDPYEGDLIDITATHLVLDTDDGQVLVPLSGALSTAIVIRRSGNEEQTADE